MLFLIALQATFFSPAKYGILPEILPDSDLSRANGILEMSTFVAIVIGTALGSVLFDAWKDRLWLIGVDRRRDRRARHRPELPHSARAAGGAGPPRVARIRERRDRRHQAPAPAAACCG